MRELGSEPSYMDVLDNTGFFLLNFGHQVKCFHVLDPNLIPKHSLHWPESSARGVWCSYHCNVLDLSLVYECPHHPLRQ